MKKPKPKKPRSWTVWAATETDGQPHLESAAFLKVTAELLAENHADRVRAFTMTPKRGGK